MTSNTTGYNLTLILVLVSLALAGVGAILMTEVGQFMDLPREWVFTYFRIREPLSVLIMLLAICVVFLQLRQRALRNWQAAGYVVLIVGCIFVINWFVPHFWLRSQQHGAVFISVQEADQLLPPEEDMLVLEINGDARAYPRGSMLLPHFAGDVVGGEEVVMSYCGLSDLPQAFSTAVDGVPADYKVIAQVNNNLIFTDNNSGELFQQITARGQYSGAQLERFPVQRMTWEAFSTIYPEGKVFYTQPNLLDRITLTVFDSGLDAHYAGEPLFPTLDMQDDRLPPQEKVWGMLINGEPLAVTRQGFGEASRVYRQLGGRKVLLTWSEDYQLLSAFYAEVDGEPVQVDEIDLYGSSDAGQLERVNLYPGIRWMVWSHWFPETDVL